MLGFHLVVPGLEFVFHGNGGYLLIMVCGSMLCLSLVLCFVEV